MVKGRDRKRAEGQGWEERRGSTGTSLDKVWRLWGGLGMQQGGEQPAWPLLFSPTLHLCSPERRRCQCPTTNPIPLPSLPG